MPTGKEKNIQKGEEDLDAMSETSILISQQNLASVAPQQPQRTYFSHICEHMKPYGGWLGLDLTVSLIMAGLNVLGPYLLSEMIARIQSDEVKGDSVFKDVSTFSLLVGAGSCFLVSKTLHAVKTNLTEKYAGKISNDVAKKIVENVTKLSYSEYSKINPGDLEEVIPSVKIGVEKFFNNSFFFIPLVAELISATVLLATKNLQYGGAFFGSIVLSFFVGWIARTERLTCLPWEKIPAIEARKSDKESELSTIITETLTHYQTQVIYDCSEEKIKELTKKIIEVLKTKEKYSSALNILSGFQVILISSINLLILGILEWQRESGEPVLAADEFVFVLTYLVGAIDNIGFLANALKDHAEAVVYINKGVKFLNSIAEDIGTEVIRNPINQIRITFDGKNKLNIKAWKNPITNTYEGTVTALAGPSGCGKSTIIRKLCRFNDDSFNPGISIEIFEEGIKEPKNIDDIANKSVWENILYVPQNPQIYNGSLKENLEVAIPKELKLSQTKKDLIINNVCKLVGLEKKLAEEGMSLGDTKATRFSGGEQQRIGIGRLLVKHAALKIKKPNMRYVMIFDEATSALDNVMEAQIVSQIYDLKRGGNLVIVIAHRLPTIIEADQIVFLRNDNGKPWPIIIGPHHSIYKNKKKDSYKRFYDAAQRVAKIDEELEKFKGYYTAKNINDFLAANFKSRQSGSVIYYRSVDDPDKKKNKLIVLQAMEVTDLKDLVDKVANIYKNLIIEKNIQVFFVYSFVGDINYIPGWQILSLGFSKESKEISFWIYTPLEMLSSDLAKFRDDLKIILVKTLNKPVIPKESKIGFKLGEEIGSEQAGLIIVELLTTYLAGETIEQKDYVFDKEDIGKLIRTQLHKAIEADIDFFSLSRSPSSLSLPDTSSEDMPYSPPRKPDLKLEKGFLPPQKPTPLKFSWNCFDLAVDLLDRDAFVAYALTKKKIEEFRRLLMPEIKHAAGLTVVYLNKEGEKSKPPKSKLLNFLPFFKPSDLSFHDKKLERHILPPSMHDINLKNLVNDYYQAHEKIKEVIININEELKILKDKYLSLEQMIKFFEDSNNCVQYPEIANNFKKLFEDLFIAPVKAFNDYCMDETIYEKYIQDYYGKKGWFAFQRSVSGEENSSMIDIAACFLNKQIIILQKDNKGKLEEIHRTANQATEQIYIEYNGYDHFIKAKKPEENLKVDDDNKSIPQL